MTSNDPALHDGHRRQSFALLSVWAPFVLLVGAIVVPISISRYGLAVFRLPNELAMRAVAIAVVVIVLIAVALRRIRTEDLRGIVQSRAHLLAGAALLWTMIATGASRDVALSLDTLPFVLSVLVVALVSAGVFADVSPHAVATAVFVPATLNTIVVLLQASRIWNPWVFDGAYSRIHKNALLGNPNDVGAYLAAPAIFAVAMALGARKLRPLYAFLALFFILGIAVTETLTALGGIFVSATVLLILRYRRRGIVGAICVVVLLAGLLMLYAPLRARVLSLGGGPGVRTVDTLISGRMPAMVSAWEMFRDDPLTGVGPGVFKREYFDYRVAAVEPYGTWFTYAVAAPREHFRQVHNDHLQLLAESGIPGYLLMLAALIVVASASRASRAGSERAEISRLAAAPIAIGLAITMLTGFPLQLAAPAYTFALVGGVALSWNRSEDAA